MLPDKQWYEGLSRVRGLGMSRELMTLEFSRLLAKIAQKFSWDYDFVDLLWKAMNLMDPSFHEPRDANH